MQARSKRKRGSSYELGDGKRRKRDKPPVRTKFQELLAPDVLQVGAHGYLNWTASRHRQKEVVCLCLSEVHADCELQSP